MFIWTGSTGSTFFFSREVYSLLYRLHDFSVTIPRSYKYVYVFIYLFYLFNSLFILD